MKLAELLKQRSALQDKADDLAKRVYTNVRLIDGDTPAETPDALIVEIDRTYDALESVVNRINRANIKARGTGGETLSELLLRRELLGRKVGVRKHAAKRATTGSEYRDESVLYKRHVDVPKLRREADELGQQYRELDNQIQSLNWSVTVD